MGFAERQSQRDWEEAYNAGYNAGYENAIRNYMKADAAEMHNPIESVQMKSPRKPKKPRVIKSKKTKLLNDLTDKAWKSYKRKYPKGKKTWVTIRGQVSRSQNYKKKAKRLG